MKQKQNSGYKNVWVRCQVAEPIGDTAKYVKRRIGLANVPMAWTYLLHFFLFGRDPEEICQQMAASGHLQLQPIDDLQMELVEEHTHDEPTQ